MNIIISNSSQDPIYQQIVNQVRNMIVEGRLMPGDALPSIRNLAKELQISIITTKRAYEELERDGLIETVGGKGSYVSGQNKELIKEKRLKMVEEKLLEAVEEGRLLGIDIEELVEMVRVFYLEG